MYKDIAVVMTESDGDEHALAQSIALARQFSARLLPLLAFELPEPAYNAWALLPDPSMERLHETLREKASTLASRAQAIVVQAEGDAHDVQLVEAIYATAWEAASRECHGADLIVVGKTNRPDMLQRHAQGIATLLLQSGRPVLVLPGEASLAALPKNILVAWRPGAEATRALHDALPFLRAASSVEIVAYDDVDAHEPARRRALVEHLRRHGVEATSFAHESRGADLAGLLFAHARKVGADLLVAGGYGHSRLREWALGGVTRDLLISTRLPVLLSH